MDLITHRRSAEPRLEAVYLLMPTSENVELVLRDFNPNPTPVQSKSRKTKDVVPAQAAEGPKYGGAHLHFIDGQSEAGAGCESALVVWGAEALTVAGFVRRAGINDDLVGRITAGLPSSYLLALTELYINFHGQSW